MATTPHDKTITFSIADERELEMKRTLQAVYRALIEKGYNPINQILGKNIATTTRAV